MSESTSVHLQRCLDRLRAGDETARKELIDCACRRLTHLTRTMLRDYRRLKRWEDTDDVFQSAMMRLYRALQDVTPPTPRDFHRLAALQIRRELIDLARHYFGPQGQAANQESRAGPDSSADPPRPACEPSDSTLEPVKLAAWGEFHQQVERLPDKEREVFELVWYQGLGHTEVAELLEVSAKTVRRRWLAACLWLREALGGELPGL